MTSETKTVTVEEQRAMGLLRNTGGPKLVPSLNDRLPLADVAPLASGLMQMPTNGETDGRALAAIESVSERSTPEQRARATGIKMMLGMGASAIVVIVLAIVGLDVVTLGIIEVIGCVIAFVVALWLDQRDSPLSTERHKATEYSKIRRWEIASQERMFNRRMDTLERIMGGVLVHSRKDRNNE